MRETNALIANLRADADVYKDLPILLPLESHSAGCRVEKPPINADNESDRDGVPCLLLLRASQTVNDIEPSNYMGHCWNMYNLRAVCHIEKCIL